MVAYADDKGMEELLKQLEDRILFSSSSPAEKDEMMGLVTTIKKMAAKNDFKLSSTIKRQNDTRKLMTSIIEEMGESRNRIIEINNKLEKSHRNILDSINYAKGIQNSMLVDSRVVDEHFSDNFIMYLPKENVSGDFYIFHEMGDMLLFGVADCTGHGVPGAFLSILGVTYLNEIIKVGAYVNPASILEELRDRIKAAFSQFGNDNYIYNSLDMSLCSLHVPTKTLSFSGANLPLMMIRDGQLLEIKATRTPVGYSLNEATFVNNELVLEDDDRLYLFTDGYSDQLGGPLCHKMKRKVAREYIISNHKLPMVEQKLGLEHILRKWKQNEPQTDDITVWGVKPF